jgi:hypothetical protein
MIKRFLAAIALFALFGAAPAGDRIGSLGFLVGSWTCTYEVKGSPTATYAAKYSYDLGGSWLRETDSWTGGGGDFGFFTFDPKTHVWTSTVVDSGRGTTVFRAQDDGTDSKTWRSVYPDTSMKLAFNKISPTEYTLSFSQTMNGKTNVSFDRCTKKS